MEKENVIELGVEIDEEDIRNLYALKKNIPEYRDLSVQEITHKELQEQLKKRQQLLKDRSNWGSFYYFL